MSLHRLIYCSRPVAPTRGDLKGILEACERNNPVSHVTGMLLFTSDCFVQLLEGGRGAVNACFQKISRDRRHDDIEVVSSGPIDFRLFERWSMHYVSIAGASACDLRRFAASGRFDPFETAPSVIEQLCVHASLLACRSVAEPVSPPAEH